MRIPMQRFLQITGMLCCFSLLGAGVSSAQVTSVPRSGIGADRTETVQTAKPDPALRALVAQQALTVRALIAYDRIPMSLVTPLTGMRGRGIDVLGASEETLIKLLDGSEGLVTPQERAALQHIVETLRSTTRELSSGPGAPTRNLASTRPAPPPMPPMALPSALPIVDLGSAQYAGMITTAKEATRTLMGPLSAEEAVRFEQQWAGYYDFPSVEIRDYFRSATALLTEFLNIREAVATTAGAFDQAWVEAMTAAQYDSEAHADAALAQADLLKDTLAALEARAQQLAEALQDLGAPPDPQTAKTNAYTYHHTATETIAEMLQGEVAPLEGIWYGAVEYDEDTWIEGIKGGPLLFVVYAVGEPGQTRYRALQLDAADYDDKTDPYLDILAMHSGDSDEMPPLADVFGDQTLRHTYEMQDEEDTIVITISAQRLTDGERRFDYPPPVALETIERAYDKLQLKQAGKRAEHENKVLAPTETVEESVRQLGGHVGSGAVLSLFEQAAQSELEDVRRHNRLTPLFVQAANEWMRLRPFSAKTTLAQDRAALSALIARQHGDSAGLQKTAQPPQQAALVAQQAPATEEQAAAATAAELEQAQAELDAKRETIQFHQQNMIIIERNLERDRADLTSASDPERRAQLEFRIVAALSDLQSEKDRIASIETGTLVHTRSAFDDYAHAGFIANIARGQQQMAKFQHSSDALFKLASLLPGNEGNEARAFVERQLTPDIRLSMDQAALKQIADALGKKVEGHYLGLQAQSDEQAAYASLGLEAAENIKTAADSSMMVLSLFGGQYVDAAYQATTGYIEGGATEAVLRTVSLFGPTAGAAAEAMRGYREGGVEGAIQRGAISFVTSKGIEYGMGKVLGRGRSSDSPDAPSTPAPDSAPLRPGELGPDAPSLVRAPPSADQRALEQFQRARKQGEALAQDYRQAQQRLTAAGAAGASAEDILRLQAEVRDKVIALNGNPHARNFLKYKGDPLSQRAYNAHLKSVHAEVEAHFHANMQAGGWNQPALREFRNAASSGSVGMDFDIGLDQAMARQISRNGKPARLNEWQEDAQKAWNQAYEAATGRKIDGAWETITTHAHAESYRDLSWLAEDKSAISRTWAQQGADVTRYKSWHMLNDPSLSQMERLQEISRGAAKDMQTKLDPVLDKIKPSSGSETRFLEARSHWAKVRSVLNDFGNNSIDPVTADRRIRELSGGKSIPEVVEEMSYLLESAAKFGKR